MEKVIANNSATALTKMLEDKHGSLLFHISGGCCGGTELLLFEASEFRVGETDVLVGQISNTPVYIPQDQYEYWQYQQLQVSTVKGMGGNFSLESASGEKFVLDAVLV